MRACSCVAFPGLVCVSTRTCMHSLSGCHHTNMNCHTVCIMTRTHKNSSLELSWLICLTSGRCCAALRVARVLVYSMPIYRQVGNVVVLIVASLSLFAMRVLMWLCRNVCFSEWCCNPHTKSSKRASACTHSCYAYISYPQLATRQGGPYSQLKNPEILAAFRTDYLDLLEHSGGIWLDLWYHL